MHYLKYMSKAFNLTDEGVITIYIGMNVSKDPDGTITMIQPENVILKKVEYVNGRKQEWHYRSVIGHEYISLSQSMRNLIPLVHKTLEVSSVFGMKCDSCNSYTKTFEDNKGAIGLRKEPEYRPQTKNISTKWYHFREHIKKHIKDSLY